MMKFICGLLMGGFIISYMKKYLLIRWIYFSLIFIHGFLFIFNYSDICGIFSGIFMGEFGWDKYSYFLVILSVWISGMMLMGIQEEQGQKGVAKVMMISVLIIIFCMFFSSLNLLMFYFFFEVSLLPTFFLIVYWGSNPERVSAGMYLLLYTLVISLPMLVYIFWVLKMSGSGDFGLLGVCLINLGVLSFMDYLIIFMPFFIKMPIYFFHLWLPKAHVEAPVYGSMVLAAILLKLGGYGLIRLMPIFMISCSKYNYLIFSISIVGALICSGVCLVQVDMKSLVAYSSVVHMNFMLAALMTLSSLGVSGSYVMMIGHGLCSSCLFFMVNIFYSSSKSRVLFMNKGFLMMAPSYALWWFLMCSANFSFPLSVNFFSEIMMISVILSWETSVMWLIMMILFMSSAYSLYLFSYLCHGEGHSEYFMSPGAVKNFLVLMMHMYPLGAMIINMVVFL